jgi:hypothetical protein
MPLAYPRFGGREWSARMRHQLARRYGEKLQETGTRGYGERSLSSLPWPNYRRTWRNLVAPSGLSRRPSESVETLLRQAWGGLRLAFHRNRSQVSRPPLPAPGAPLPCSLPLPSPLACPKLDSSPTQGRTLWARERIQRNDPSRHEKTCCARIEAWCCRAPGLGSRTDTHRKIRLQLVCRYSLKSL